MRLQSCLIAVPTVLLMVGCASKPPPVADLTRAQTLVAQAQQSDAPRYDSADLAAAQDKLQRADANAKDHPPLAAQLAQEASADAELALARTRANKEQDALQQVNASLEALRTQTELTPGNEEPPPAEQAAPPGTPVPPGAGGTTEGGPQP